MDGQETQWNFLKADKNVLKLLIFFINLNQQAYLDG